MFHHDTSDICLVTQLRSSNIGCKWMGSACTAGRPQVLRELSGRIYSPTMYDSGEYRPNARCVWQIIVPEWMVSDSKLGLLRLFTVHKRHLGQGNVFTPVCHSFHRGCIPACNGGVHPLGIHYPWVETPWQTSHETYYS